jgi:hypothetical protein
VAETKHCTASARTGRMAKARQFLVAAETIATVIDDQEIADAFVTLCVHAGIAAADVICCARLGVYHSGGTTTKLWRSSARLTSPRPSSSRRSWT